MSITVCDSGGHPRIHENPAGRKVQIRNRDAVQSVPTEKICYIESSNRKVIFCMENGKAECYGKISELERELGAGFFRIHKGYLINLRCVMRYGRMRYGRTDVFMKNGDVLPVSKYKYREFVKAYRAYNSGGGAPHDKEEQDENNDTDTE